MAVIESLNERAALAAGWLKVSLLDPIWADWQAPDGYLYSRTPDCEHSMDAAYALLWPLVQAKGYTSFGLEEFPEYWYCTLSSPDEAVGYGGATIAAAFLNACLEVLEEKP